VVRDHPAAPAAAERGLAEEADGERGGRLAGRDAQREDFPRGGVDDRAAEDRAEEAADAREVDEPDVVRAFRDQPAGPAREYACAGRTGARTAQGALHAGARRLEPEAREDSREPSRAPPRPLALEAVRDLADEVGEPVDRRLGLDEAPAAGFDFAVPVTTVWTESTNARAVAEPERPYRARCHRIARRSHAR
jgi:hypothetical protein